MQSRSIGEMEVALRVLTAINAQRSADPKDVEDLRHFAPASAARSLDELACEVIVQALEHRKQQRAKA